jgi:hypothetical protein
MAKRHDSSSNSADRNERPHPHNEDAVPEMTESIRGRADDESDDEFEVEDVDGLDEEEEDNDEGAI